MMTTNPAIDTIDTTINNTMAMTMAINSDTILPFIDIVLSMSGTFITYSSMASIYIFMMLIFLGHSLVIASVRAGVWTTAACVAIRFDYLVIRAIRAAGGNHNASDDSNSNGNGNDSEWSLQWSLLMLTPFIIMLYPCFNMTRVPRPWLLWWERVMMYTPWMVLLVATLVQSWTVMELAMVAQFVWARYSVNTKQEWIRRSCDHSFQSRVLAAPPHVEHSLSTDVITATTPLLPPIAHIIGDYLAADEQAPLDLLTNDVIARFATDAWLAHTNNDDIAELPGSHHCHVTSVGHNQPLYMMHTSLPLRLGNHHGPIKVRVPVRYSLRGHPTYTLDFDGTTCEHSAAARHAWSELHHMTSWLSLPFDNRDNGALVAAIAAARVRPFASHIVDDGQALPLVGDVPKPPAELAHRRLSLVMTIKMATWNSYDTGVIGLQYQFDSVRARHCCTSCGNDDITRRDEVADDAAIAAELADTDDTMMMANTTDGLVSLPSSPCSPCSPSSSLSRDIDGMKSKRGSFRYSHIRRTFPATIQLCPEQSSSNDDDTDDYDHDMIIVDGIHHVIPHALPSLPSSPSSITV